jgi:hypothetical protein
MGKSRRVARMRGPMACPPRLPEMVGTARSGAFAHLRFALQLLSISRVNDIEAEPFAVHRPFVENESSWRFEPRADA